jgi:hypothetical protein
MSRKILLVILGVGVAGLASATLAGAGNGSKIPLEERGIIAGTMAHLKGVKLRAVAKLPDYFAKEDDIKNWDYKPGHLVVLYNQLDILLGIQP